MLNNTFPIKTSARSNPGCHTLIKGPVSTYINCKALCTQGFCDCRFRDNSKEQEEIGLWEKTKKAVIKTNTGVTIMFSTQTWLTDHLLPVSVTWVLLAQPSILLEISARSWVYSLKHTLWMDSSLQSNKCVNSKNAFGGHVLRPREGTWRKGRRNCKVKMSVCLGKGRYVESCNACLTLMACVQFCLSSSFPDYVMWKQKVAVALSGELIWLVALQYPEHQGTVYRVKYTALSS